MDGPSSQNPTQRAEDSDTDVEAGDNASDRQWTPQAADDATQPESERKEVDDPSRDEDVVDWDGPDDPENPMNWPDKKKWLNIVLISVLTLVTPLGSSMFAPGIPRIMVEFNETSPLIATFVVSVYVLGFAFGPLVVAPLSEVYGRAVLYNWGNVFFVLFTVGTALSQNMAMMMAFRFLMGFAGSVPITIGSGSIADIMPIESRGKAMSVWALGPLLGPCIGPLAGGYLIQAAGWRWVYWLVTIIGGVFIPGSFLFIKETYAPVVLEQKARRLRKETGNPNLRPKEDGGDSLSTKVKLAIVRPLKLLFITPIVGLMALYMAVAYGILYLLIATFSFVYKDEYGFDEGESGLTFLPAGIGMMIGVLTFGALSDVIVKRRQRQGLEHKPEVRLSPKLALPCGIVLPIGLFLYGWTAEYGIHFIVPMLGVAIFSCGLMGVMMCVQNYLLDTYPRYAASVTAALAVLRSLAAALLPLGGLDMYNALGLGWGNSLLAFICVIMVPIPVVFYKFGERLRKRFNPTL